MLVMVCSTVSVFADKGPVEVTQKVLSTWTSVSETNIPQGMVGNPYYEIFIVKLIPNSQDVFGGAVRPNEEYLLGKGYSKLEGFDSVLGAKMLLDLENGYAGQGAMKKHSIVWAKEGGDTFYIQDKDPTGKQVLRRALYIGEIVDPYKYADDGNIAKVSKDEPLPWKTGKTISMVAKKAPQKQTFTKAEIVEAEVTVTRFIPANPIIRIDEESMPRPHEGYVFTNIDLN